MKNHVTDKIEPLETDALIKCLDLIESLLVPVVSDSLKAVFVTLDELGLDYDGGTGKPKIERRANASLSQILHDHLGEEEEANVKLKNCKIVKLRTRDRELTPLTPFCLNRPG